MQLNMFCVANLRFTTENILNLKDFIITLFREPKFRILHHFCFLPDHLKCYLLTLLSSHPSWWFNQLGVAKSIQLHTSRITLNIHRLYKNLLGHFKQILSARIEINLLAHQCASLLENNAFFTRNRVDFMSSY